MAIMSSSFNFSTTGRNGFFNNDRIGPMRLFGRGNAMRKQCERQQGDCFIHAPPGNYFE